MTPSDDIIVGACALAISLLITPLAAQVATRLGLVDRPGPLKPHSVATPYLGGLGVASGTAIGAGLWRPWLLVPLAMALGLGTADDIRPLPPVARLLAEIATGLAVAIMVSTRFSGVAGFVLVTIATVALMNAFNLLDGLDALCASVALFSAAGFAVILTGEARYLAIALCGAVAGFLVFNKPPARIYLGDGGAYVIGTGMAALLASAWGPVRPVPTGVAGLALVAVPAAELAFAVIRRARSRQSLLLGDRNHPYDQLVRRGWTREKAVASYAVVALVMAGVAVLTSMLRTPAAFALTGVSCIGLLVLGVHWGFIAPEPSKPTNHVQP